MTEENSHLDSLRQRISMLDDQLIELLAERFEISRLIGEFKRSHDMASWDPAREAVMLARWAEQADEHHLDPAFAQSVIRLIVARVVAEHEEIKAYGAA